MVCSRDGGSPLRARVRGQLSSPDDLQVSADDEAMGPVMVELPLEGYAFEQDLSPYPFPGQRGTPSPSESRGPAAFERFLKRYTSDGIRTRNLSLRRGTPSPLGHGSSARTVAGRLFLTGSHGWNDPFTRGYLSTTKGCPGLCLRVAFRCGHPHLPGPVRSTSVTPGPTPGTAEVYHAHPRGTDAAGFLAG